MKINLPILADNAQFPGWLIALFVVTGVLMIATVVVIIIFLKKKKGVKVDDSLWVENLGGKDNIESVSQVGSRINLVLKDKEIINKDNLKELGVKSILVMSNKVTLVVEANAEDIAKAINEALKA